MIQNKKSFLKESTLIFFSFVSLLSVLLLFLATPAIFLWSAPPESKSTQKTTLPVSLTNTESNTKSSHLVFTATVSKNEMTIGERITLTINLTQSFPQEDQENQINDTDIAPLPLLKKRLGDFIVEKYQIINSGIQKVKSPQKSPKATSKEYRQSIRYTITTYKTGDLTIPKIRYQLKTVTVLLPAIPIKVISLLQTNGQLELSLSEQDTLATTIKGKVNPLIIWLGVLLLVVVIVLIGYFFLRPRIRPPPIPFYEQTLQHLAQLKTDYKNKSKKPKTLTTLEKGESKKSLPHPIELDKWFYYSLSEIIKHYLEKKEGYKGHEGNNNPALTSMTTHQFQSHFSDKNDYELEHYDFYLSFFEYADNIKFREQLHSTSSKEVQEMKKVATGYLNKFIAQVEQYKTQQLEEDKKKP